MLDGLLSVASRAIDVAPLPGGLRRALSGVVRSEPAGATESAASSGNVTAEHEGPPDRQSLIWDTTMLGVQLAGVGLALAGRVIRFPQLPALVPAAVSLADHTPQLREALENRVGRVATDAVFSLGGVSTQSLAQSPLGIAVEAAQRLSLLTESHARQEVWRRRGEELGAYSVEHRGGAGERHARPAALPPGPVERYSRSAAPAGAAAYAATLGLSASPNRALGVLSCGVPRAARMGRDAFSAQLSRGLAKQGMLAGQRDALRLLDRIDTVVLDSSALLTGRGQIGQIIPLNGVADEQLVARVHELVDPDAPGRSRAVGGWSVEPLDGGLRQRFGDAAQCVAKAERVLAINREGRAVCLATVQNELDPHAEALVEAARTAGTVLLAGRRSGLAERLDIDTTVPGDSRLATSVRELQEQGQTVAVVSARRHSALAAADIGVGILAPDRAAPPGAHVLCGPGLATACLLLGAVRDARQISERSTQLALAGALTGGALALVGPAATAPSWAALAGHVTALTAIASGAWAGTSAASRTLPAPIDRTPWHAIPADVVLDRLGSALDGLSASDAERRQSAGTDADDDPATRGVLRAAAAELANPLTPTLAAGAGISAVVGSVMDALTITTVLGMNALVGAGQRLGADRALRQLMSATTLPVRLRRDGAEIETPAEALVVGDVITLRAGDAVPADCRLLLAEGLDMDESSLTGESQLATKTTEPTAAEAIGDRTSMLYQGTVVAAGTAVAAVVATGSNTEVGRTARLRGDSATQDGGVHARMRQLTRVTLPISIGAGVVLFGVRMLRGGSPLAALGPAVSLAVAAVPEGLPFVATVAELSAARRLSGRGALVRSPATIETLGRVDVLCFDKTGTLTEGKINLRTISDGRAAEPAEELTPAYEVVLEAALRASPQQDEDCPLPHPTDRAVVDGGTRLGISAAQGIRAWRRVEELPFEPGRGYHGVLGQLDGAQRLSVKGAPEIVLARCASWQRDGQTVAFDAEAEREVNAEIDRLASAGHRVLAVAERPASDRRDLDEGRIGELCLLGLLGLTDTIRPAAAEAIATLQHAGVQIMVVTGDHPSTAEATAAELGALAERRVMTGPELEALDEDELREVLPQVAVFARVSPAQKARIVDVLQRAGHTVAVTGDGANDAPAIWLAHAGIAVGSGATSAAREAADLVITDDRLETIVDTLIEGRSMWASVRDALAILLGGNLGEIAFTIGSGLLSAAETLNTRQVLLVNLLTDMLPAMAVAMRPPRGITPDQLLAEGPDASLGSALNREITLRATVTAGAAGAAWLLGRATGTPTRASTVALIALVSAQLTQTAATGTRSPVVLGASAISLAALGAIVQFPGVSSFFGCRPLGPAGWTIALGSAVTATALGVVVPRAHRALTRHGAGEDEARRHEVEVAPE